MGNSQIIAPRRSVVGSFACIRAMQTKAPDAVARHQRTKIIGD